MSCIQFLYLQEWQLDGTHQLLWLLKFKRNRLVNHSNFSLHDKIQKIYCSLVKKKKKNIMKKSFRCYWSIKINLLWKDKSRKKTTPVDFFIRRFVLQLLPALSSVFCLESHTKPPRTVSASHLSQQPHANSTLGCHESQEKCNLPLT